MSFIEPSRAHLCRREAPVDGSLGHLGRAGSNINKQAPPAGGRADAGEPKNPMTDRRRRRARLRREAPLHGPTLTPGHDPRKTTAPRATRSPGQERTTFVLLTSLGQWTGDNRGTGDRRRRTFRLLTGAVGGGGASCRRGRRKGKGGGVRQIRAAGLDFFSKEKKSRSALHFIEDAREQRAEVERVVRVHVGQGVERHLHQGHLHGLLDTDDGLR